MYFAKLAVAACKSDKSNNLGRRFGMVTFDASNPFSSRRSPRPRRFPLSNLDDLPKTHSHFAYFSSLVDL